MRKSGVEIGRVEIDKDGKITIFAGKPVENGAAETNEWDEVFDGKDQAETRQ